MSPIQFFVVLGADMLITTGLLIMFAKGTSTAQTAGRIEQNNINTKQVMQEKRQWNRWDTKLVYSPDIVSAILEFRGTPIVEINNPISNDPYSWGSKIGKYDTENTKDSDIAQIYTDFQDSTKQYISVLEKDVNGAVEKVHFIVYVEG